MPRFFFLAYVIFSPGTSMPPRTCTRIAEKNKGEIKTTEQLDEGLFFGSPATARISQPFVLHGQPTEAYLPLFLFFF